MFKVGDVVRVNDYSGEVVCIIIAIGEDEYNVPWYKCTPIEFSSISREFTADKLEKVTTLNNKIL